MRFSNEVTDDEGFPSFVLVNKVTGQAIKHSVGAKHPVINLTIRLYQLMIANDC